MCVIVGAVQRLRDTPIWARRASRRGSEAPRPVVLIPHDRADLRFGCFRRCTELPAIDPVHFLHRHVPAYGGA